MEAFRKESDRVVPLFFMVSVDAALEFNHKSFSFLVDVFLANEFEDFNWLSFTFHSYPVDLKADKVILDSFLRELGDDYSSAVLFVNAFQARA